MVSIGPKQCTETLRTALAMGCDKGIHILTDKRTDYMELQPFAVAQLLQKVVEKEESNLVLLGKQGIDSDCGQTGPLLAGFTGFSQVTFAANMDVTADKNALTVERETDAGTETVQAELPAVVTCDLRLNEPRYASKCFTPILILLAHARGCPNEILFGVVGKSHLWHFLFIFLLLHHGIIVQPFPTL